jgi:hypothetical protein
MSLVPGAILSILEDMHRKTGKEVVERRMTTSGAQKCQWAQNHRTSEAAS